VVILTLIPAYAKLLFMTSLFQYRFCMLSAYAGRGQPKSDFLSGGCDYEKWMRYGVAW